MPSVQNCSIVNCDNRSPDVSSRNRGSAGEEWVTRKKVEITTTKNIETKIHRQLVLEDGRVLDEEVPTVTIDRTEDKQIFETDHDEERDLKDNDDDMALNTTFDTAGGGILGDKFSRVKTTKDIKENITRTEDVQNIGNIRNREVANLLKDKKNIGKHIKISNEQQQVVKSQPRTVFKSRNHHVVTDKEDVEERRWMSGGKMKKEEIKTEEHMEYDSDDSDDSVCSSSSTSSAHSSHYQLKPEEYKTRTEESFTEYFKLGKGKVKTSMVKIGEGPHYKAETKEGSKEDDQHWIKKNNNRAVKQSTHKQLTQVRSLDNQTKQSAVATTDRRMKQQFGSSRMSSSSVDLRRMGSGQGEDIKKCSSTCDVRPKDSREKVYIAKVIQSEKNPAVKMRKKKTDLNYYTANCQSANFSSSGHPIRPPRAKEYTFPNCRLPESKKHMLKTERPQSLNLTEKYYFGDSAMKTGKSKYQLLPSRELGRNYHSTENLSNYHPIQNISNYHSTQNLSSGHTKHHHSERHSSGQNENTRIQAACSKSNYQLFPTLRRDRNYHSTQSLSDRSSHYKESERPRSVNIVLDESVTEKSNSKLIPSGERFKNHHLIQDRSEDSMKHYQSTGNIYKSVIKERHSQGRSLLKHEPHYLSVGDISHTCGLCGCSSSRDQPSKQERDITIHRNVDRKSSGKLIFSSEKPLKKEDRNLFKLDKKIHHNIPAHNQPVRTVPIDIQSGRPQSPLASPATKYRTRVVVNGAA